MDEQLFVILALAVEFERSHDGEHTILASIVIFGGEEARTPCKRVCKYHQRGPVLSVQVITGLNRAIKIGRAHV